MARGVCPRPTDLMRGFRRSSSGLSHGQPSPPGSPGLLPHCVFLVPDPIPRGSLQSALPAASFPSRALLLWVPPTLASGRGPVPCVVSATAEGPAGSGEAMNGPGLAPSVTALQPLPSLWQLFSFLYNKYMGNNYVFCFFRY